MQSDSADNEQILTDVQGILFVFARSSREEVTVKYNTIPDSMAANAHASGMIQNHGGVKRFD